MRRTISTHSRSSPGAEKSSTSSTEPARAAGGVSGAEEIAPRASERRGRRRVVRCGPALAPSLDEPSPVPRQQRAAPLPCARSPRHRPAASRRGTTARGATARRAAPLRLASRAPRRAAGAAGRRSGARRPSTRRVAAAKTPARSTSSKRSSSLLEALEQRREVAAGAIAVPEASRRQAVETELRQRPGQRERESGHARHRSEVVERVARARGVDRAGGQRDGAEPGERSSARVCANGNEASSKAACRSVARWTANR